MNSNWPGVHDAVELCPHVAAGEYPILNGQRDAPKTQAHSGWCFQCGIPAADSAGATEIRSVKDVITADPTVCYIIDSPYGTTVERNSPDEEWIVTGRQVNTPT